MRGGGGSERGNDDEELGLSGNNASDVLGLGLDAQIVVQCVRTRGRLELSECGVESTASASVSE